MGITVNKDQSTDNELSRRIDADLRAKAMQNSGSASDIAAPDFAEDSAYLKNFKKTSRFGWVWIVLIVLAIIAVILIFI